MQKCPDFVYELPTTEEEDRLRLVSTNPRYKFFRQVHFTAGDYEQFLEHWKPLAWCRNTALQFLHGRWTEETIHQVSENRVKWYRSTLPLDIYQTFEYYFHTFKKGIFIQVRNHQLITFLPFSKVDYQNDWASSIKVDPEKYDSFTDLLMAIQKRDLQYKEIPFDMKKVNTNPQSWYANNGLLRYEFPPAENDSGINILKDMLCAVVEERRIPDIDFFLNKRDFPLLKKDGTEAYDALHGHQKPCPASQKLRFGPSFSMCTAEAYADLAVPTWEDWRRASFLDHSPPKLFGKEYKTFFSTKDLRTIPFREKEKKAVFRGASTGLGYTRSTNPRLDMCWRSRNDSSFQNRVDARITKWNLRPRRKNAQDYYDSISEKDMQEIGLGEFLTPLQQTQKYKYLLHLPGHSCAFRLACELSSSSLVIYWKSAYHLWFYPLLEHKKHFMVVENSDELLQVLDWCDAHPEECEQMIRNANEFYDHFLTREGILDFWQQLLVDVHQSIGRIEYPSLTEKQKAFHRERDLLKTLTVVPSSTKRKHAHNLAEWLTSIQQCVRQLPPIYLSSEEGKRSLLVPFTLRQHNFCRKVSESVFEFQHEALLGRKVINSMRNVNPNFMQLLGHYDNFVVLEYVPEAVTLEQWIKGQRAEHVIDNFLSLLMILCGALSEAQRWKGFLHYDLYPWNILVRQHPEMTTQHYSLSLDRNMTLRSKIYPFVVDYGRSFAVLHESLAVHNVEPFELCLLQDIISVLYSSMFTILSSFKISPMDAQKVTHVMNYFAGTEYCPSTFHNILQVKNFLRFKKKYSNILRDPKKSLRGRGIDHFVAYLCSRKNTLYVHTFRNGNLGLEINVHSTMAPLVTNHHQLVGPLDEDRFVQSCFLPDDRLAWCSNVLTHFRHDMNETTTGTRAKMLMILEHQHYFYRSLKLLLWVLFRYTLGTNTEWVYADCLAVEFDDNESHDAADGFFLWIGQDMKPIPVVPWEKWPQNIKSLLKSVVGRTLWISSNKRNWMYRLLPNIEQFLFRSVLKIRTPEETVLQHINTQWTTDLETLKNYKDRLYRADPLYWSFQSVEKNIPVHIKDLLRFVFRICTFMEKNRDFVLFYKNGPRTITQQILQRLVLVLQDNPTFFTEHRLLIAMHLTDSSSAHD